MSEQVVCDRAPSRRVRDAIAPFGLTIERGVSEARAPEDGALRALRDLPRDSIALLTGPSGCGKSTLVRSLRLSLEQGGADCEMLGPNALARSGRCVVDLVDGDLSHAMSCLARAGLGEARLLARRACDLSEGQRWRLLLARAMARAESHTERWILIDEFCSLLDRETARGVCASVRRWVSSGGPARLVVASAHEDLAGLLGADLCVRFDRRGGTTLERGVETRRAKVRIEAGTIEDYDALGDLHYRGGRPATWTRVLRAVGETDKQERLAGVLVESCPTLNSAWRDLAWPGRYTKGDKRERAQRLNRELRCISRVVVDGRWRSMGLARRLVETALATAQTPATEAKAAMGLLSPFFERAGMRPYREPICSADARLVDALTHAGIDARDLIVGERADEAARDPFVRRELDSWVRASRATRSLAGLAWGQVARAAGARLAGRGVCYAHVA